MINISDLKVIEAAQYLAENKFTFTKTKTKGRFEEEECFLLEVYNDRINKVYGYSHDTKYPQMLVNMSYRDAVVLAASVVKENKKLNNLVQK